MEEREAARAAKLQELEAAKAAAEARQDYLTAEQITKEIEVSDFGLF